MPPTHARNSCYDAKQLEQFVAERISEVDESAIVHHLTECADCQRALEQVTAGGAVWSNLNRYFQGRESETQRTDVFESTSTDAAYEHILEYLGPTDDPDMLGRLGSLEVCGFVGQGSTGVVLKAFESRLNRYVAVKILAPSLANNGPARRRFEREARAVAAVTNEHVVPVFAVDECRGLPFIVMQYIGGGSLDRRIDQQGPLSAVEVVRVGMQVATGLAAAHAQGIVHRDVKPANVMMEAGVDRAMVTDFGMARVTDEASMTRSGVISGTPQFMSPEQAKGESIDPRSDLFSLGSLLYTASTGRPPFRADTVYGVIQRVCEAEPRPIREFSPEVPAWLEAFIAKLCAKQKEDRFDSAAEVSSLLSAELAHMQSPTFVREPERHWLPSPSGNRWRSVIAALVTLLIVAIGGIGLSQIVADRDGEGGATPAAGAEDRASALAGETKRMDPVVWNGKARPLFRNVARHSVSAKPNGTLSIDADRANIEVLSGDTDEVQFEILREVIADDESAVRELLAKHEMKFEPTEDGLQMVSKVGKQADKPEGGPQYRQITFRVRVPKKQHLDLLTAGNLAVQRVDGSVSAVTKGGNVAIKHVGPLTVDTGGGNIVVKSVMGPAEVKTGGGNIQFAHIAGDVKAHTAGGNISLGWVEGAARAITAGGNIDCTLSKQLKQDCEMKTTAGNITLKIAKEMRCNLDASTLQGNVSSPFSKPGDKNEKSIKMSVNGGGPKLETQTISGNVNVHYLQEDDRAKVDDASSASFFKQGGMRTAKSVRRASFKSADHETLLTGIADQIARRVQVEIRPALVQLQTHADAFEKDVRLQVEDAVSGCTSECLNGCTEK